MPEAMDLTLEARLSDAERDRDAWKARALKSRARCVRCEGEMVMISHLECCEHALEISAEAELLRMREHDLKRQIERWTARVKEVESRMDRAMRTLEGGYL